MSNQAEKYFFDDCRQGFRYFATMKMLLLLICTGPCIHVFANDLFVPDISLMRQWNQDFYEKHTFQPFPKIIYFKNLKKQKSVVFVGTKHKDWKNSQEKIKTAIEKENPEIILIEGIAKSDGISPRIWDDKPFTLREYRDSLCDAGQSEI